MKEKSDSQLTTLQYFTPGREKARGLEKPARTPVESTTNADAKISNGAETSYAQWKAKGLLAKAEEFLP